MSSGTPRRRQRTWSALGDLRRIPSEYEIVTHDTNWTVRRGRDAPLEQNSSSVGNLWLLTYRDHSPLQVEDWLGFRDPDQLTYRRYVTQQAEQETIVRGVLDEYAEAEHDASLNEGWVQALAQLFAPTRFPVHGLQMCAAYLGQIAPSSYINSCGAFATADLLRRVSLLAYRTRELDRTWPEHGFGLQERTLWEEEPAWQGLRRAIELALIAYDWGESFTAVNLVLRPTIDDLLLGQLAELARRSGDEQCWLLLSNLAADTARCLRWSTRLAAFALEARPENRAPLEKWLARWIPRADAAAEGVATLLAAVPGGPAVEAAVARAQAARGAVLTQAGLSPA